jgi:hypothetical protein
LESQWSCKTMGIGARRAVLDEQQHGCGGERFGHGATVVHCFGGRFGVWEDGEAVCFRVGAVVVDDCD